MQIFWKKKGINKEVDALTLNESETDLNTSDKRLRDAVSYFSSLIFDSAPSAMPESIANISEIQKSADTLIDIREALSMTRRGDFSYLVKSKGFIAGALKALQSNLNHIAWLARQVADGDLDSRMDFMGEFSSAFNSMTEQLSTVLERLNEQKDHLTYRTLHDQLTGIKNRAYFDEQIVNEMAKAKRSDSLLGVVIVNVDELKHVNDTYGREAGDAFLIEVAKRLLQGTRKIDTVARIGGDKFGMLWPSYNNNEQHFIKTKDRIISNINSCFYIEGSELKMSVSMGISTYPYDGEDPYALIRIANDALCQAKKINGTSCVFASFDRLDRGEYENTSLN